MNRRKFDSDWRSSQKQQGSVLVLMLIINLRQAEFEHILDQAEQRGQGASDNASPMSVELFDALDCMPATELREVVAMYLYGSDEALADFEVARCRADAIG